MLLEAISALKATSLIIDKIYYKEVSIYYYPSL